MNGERKEEYMEREWYKLRATSVFISVSFNHLLIYLTRNERKMYGERKEEYM